MMKYLLIGCLMFFISPNSIQAISLHDSTDIFVPDPKVVKLAQEYDRIYFPLFLESLNAIKNHDTSLITRYFDKNGCDTASSTIEIPLLINYKPGCKPVYISPMDNSRYEVEFPVQWEVPEYSDPSWNLWFKSLKWLDVYINSNYKDSVITAFKVIDDYIRSHVDYPDPDSRFTFGDHASATRLKIFTNAYLKYWKAGLQQEQFKILLQNAILCHIFYLGSLEFYASWTNHAIIVDNALIESLILLEDFKLREQFLDLAFARVFEQLRYSFTSEGIHKEHSTCYHDFIAGMLRKLINQATLSNIEIPGIIVELNRKAEKYFDFIRSDDDTFPFW